MKVQQDQFSPDTSDAAAPDASGFEKYKLTAPCRNCEPSCCKMLLIPYQTPQTFMDLDYIGYMLGFPGISMIISQSGTWQVQVEQNCRHLNTKDNTCVLHNTPHKPKTCVFFNPYNCFYKRNFSNGHPSSITRINAHSFEILISKITLDEVGNITSVPSQEEIERIGRENWMIPCQSQSGPESTCFDPSPTVEPVVEFGRSDSSG
jgi:hypothetical protein